MAKATAKKTTSTKPRKPSAKTGSGGGARRPKAAKPAEPAPTPPQAAEAPQTPPTPPTPATGATPAAIKPMTCLDAAYAVLVKLNRPMTMRAIMEQMVDRELWKSPGGLTPEATLSSAMLREIRRYGDESRFQRVDRGFYAAREWRG
jgi:hypothetical protein